MPRKPNPMLATFAGSNCPTPPLVNQVIRHRGVTWRVDTIYPHPIIAGRFDCDIVRGCCITQIAL